MGTIDYVIESAATREKFTAVIVNISKSGLCLLTSDPLTLGQHITILGSTLKEAKHPLAIVRWTEKYNDLYYKAGLEYL